ncbi:radical SAM protein [Thermoanaerobacterium thermosaccharolyticum]|uniref:radical SAM protein n=1 Tax=Thermoanaerobacterium thermosaccharolyticum TaxID=1517 RepID=UPI0027A97F2C|nr:radical SAM protein [Thermoanaerobacterium thermosaccharolyticum]
MSPSKIVFSNYTHTIEYDNNVVIYNRKSGQWIRTSKEVYDIFKYAVNNRLDIEELNNCIINNEDKKFITEVYNRLLNKKLINNTFESNNIKSIGFELTNRCNLKCIHCCVDADITHRYELSTIQVKTLFDRALLWNPSSIMLSGGEPMIRKDFIELLIYLRSKYKGEIILSTNATLINEENINFLVENIDKIDISIDGVDERSCSQVRGSGVFKKVIKNIERLKKMNYNNITLSMVVGDKNEVLEENFIELNKNLGTHPVVRRFSSIGRGKYNEKYFLNNSYEKFYISKKYLSNDYKGPINICTCGAGNKEVIIRYNGNVYPCPSFMNDNMLMGNLLVDDFAGKLFIKNYDLLENVIYKKFPECRNCKVNIFCWTCPGSLVDIKNIKNFVDRCNKLKPVLFKRVWGENLCQ